MIFPILLIIFSIILVMAFITSFKGDYTDFFMLLSIVVAVIGLITCGFELTYFNDEIAECKTNCGGGLSDANLFTSGYSITDGKFYCDCNKKNEIEVVMIK